MKISSGYSQKLELIIYSFVIFPTSSVVNINLVLLLPVDVSSMFTCGLLYRMQYHTVSHCLLFLLVMHAVSIF